jgi:aspartate aminotransferase
VLLHACAHNPTGVDPTFSDWEKILKLIKVKHHFPVFDVAYQGLATGDPKTDAGAVCLAVQLEIEFFACQSCSKIFGLYDERTGALTCFLASARAKQAVESQLKIILRTMISNPPHHGARVVATILKSTKLRQEWLQTIKAMTERILKMRQELYTRLKRLSTPGDWSHIVNQKGMFTFTGLTESQCALLTEKHHVYLVSNGRINICGI